MDAVGALSENARSTAGVLLLTIVAVEYGDTFMLRVVRGRLDTTQFQKSFFRAGHAHAGVLVILSLIVEIYADAAGLHGLTAAVARSGVPLAAILMPAGFFFAATGRGLTRPNRFVALIYLGAISLAVGVVTLGIGLLAS